MIEPDYYPLAMAAEKIGCKTDYLILLATENKLSIYVRKCGIAPLIPSETDLRHVSIYAMQRYQNNRGAELTLTDPNDSRYEYGSCDEVLVKDVALLVSAEDVARLSKKETVKTDGGEIAEMNADKALAVMALLLSKQLSKYRTGEKPNASAISKDVLPIAQDIFGDDNAQFASFNKRLGKALKQFKE